MADKRRFPLFARYLRELFPQSRRVYDVAGGMGALNAALTELGVSTVTFAARRRRLPVEFAERRFTLEEPGPCCSDDGSPYKTWMKVLGQLALDRGFSAEETVLPMEGRARVLTGIPA